MVLGNEDQDSGEAQGGLPGHGGASVPHVDGGISDLVPVAGVDGLGATRVFVLDAGVAPRLPHGRTPIDLLVASLGTVMRARRAVDLGPDVEVHLLQAPDLGTRMADFSRTPDHLALGRKSAAVLLDRLAQESSAAQSPVRPVARHHRLRDLFGWAA